MHLGEEGLPKWKPQGSKRREQGKQSEQAQRGRDFLDERGEALGLGSLRPTGSACAVALEAMKV